MARDKLIQLRRDTAANWASVNPVLANGEAGLETDTDSIKYGDGATDWNTLSYFGGGSGSTPDATTSIKGKLQLSGDLGGTASSPAVLNRTVMRTVAPVGGYGDYICTGTNDHTTVQSAVNDVISAGSGTVLIRAGSYSFGGFVQTASNVTIEGESMSGVVITLVNGANSNIFTTPAGSSALQNCVLRNLTLDGNGLNQTGMTGSNLTAASVGLIDFDGRSVGLKNNLIENVLVKNSWFNGVFMHGNVRGNLSTNTIRRVHVDTYGLRHPLGSSGFGFGIYCDFVYLPTVENCLVENGYGDGYECGHGGVRLRNCTSQNPAGVGYGQIQFPFGDNTIIEGCIANGTNIQNDANTADNVTIIGCTVLNAAPPTFYAGISVFGANSTIVGNQVYVTTQSGIRVYNGEGATISGNQVFGHINNYRVDAVADRNITLSGLQTIDDISLGVSDRVLLTNQTTGSENGIWTVKTGSWSRPTDYTGGSSQYGNSVFSFEGTLYANTRWWMTNGSAIVVGTDSSTWSQTGPTLTGNGIHPEHTSSASITGNYIFGFNNGISWDQDHCSAGYNTIDTCTYGVYISASSGSGHVITDGQIGLNTYINCTTNINTNSQVKIWTDFNTIPIQINSGLTSSSARPSISSAVQPGEIHGYSATGKAGDDGFLRLSAGGGTNTSAKTYIDIAGFYSGTPDLQKTITLNTAGRERVRLDAGGRLLIGASTGVAGQFLDVGGTSNLLGGAMLNALSNPSAPTSVVPTVKVTDGVTTQNSTTVTSATASFGAGDVGVSIVGAGIPVGATISSVTNSTTIVISANATITATGVTLTFLRVGSTSYTYAVTARSAVGETLISSGTTTTTGNATLDSGHYNVITWNAVRGAKDYRIWRTASSGTPSTTGVIGTFIEPSAPSGNFTFNDTGIAGDGSSVPTINSTGYVGIGKTAPREWLNLAAEENFAVDMDIPVNLAASFTNGGSYAATTTYYWVVTALDGTGETVKSAQATATSTSSNKTANLTWDAVPGAVSYKVYQSVTSGTYGSTSLLISVTTNSLVSTVSVTSSGAPPSVTSAYVNKLAYTGNSWIGTNLGIGVGNNASAYLHIKAGTASAGTAPLKLTAGTNLATPETGTVEFDGTHFYATISSTRYQLDQQPVSGSAGGDLTGTYPNPTIKSSVDLTGVPTAPTASANNNTTQIATTAYVDSAIAGLDAKDPVAYASTAPLPSNVYANGSSGVGATLTASANGFLVIDGVTLAITANGLRALVAGESTSANNGWYIITDVGSLVTKYVLTRDPASDQAAEIESGYITGIVAPSGLTGGANNGRAFISSAPSPFTVGTSNLTFSLVGATYAAGTGLSLSGVTFALSTPVAAVNGGTGVSNSKNLTVSNSLTLAGTDSTTMTFPSTSATIARTDAANTFTGHQTIEGVTSTGATGSGKLVFDTSPVFTTPALGTPVSGVATNLTGTGASLTAGKSGYTIQAFAATSNPADATTYYFGSRPSSAILTTHPSVKVYIPRAGTIKAVYLYFSNSSTLGSNETGTVSLRLNDTTDTQISAAVTNDSASTAFNNTALSITVSAGDFFELKWATPTWATNPTAVFPSATVYIEPS